MVNFHDPASTAFWVFWLLMLLCIAFGFLPKKRSRSAAPRPEL